MMLAIRVVLLVCLSACLHISSADAADWPQWLGTNRNGTSTEKIAPWKGDLKVLWRKAVGEGHSSPVVADGVVYLHVKVKNKDEESLIACNATTGDVNWEKSYPRGPAKFFFGNGPRGTPTVSGKRIYAIGITGLLTCFDAADGKQLWQTDTLKENKSPNLTFGISASPLVTGDNVIVQVGNNPKNPQSTAVVAYDVANGKLAWKALDDPASYAAPVLLGGKVIVLTAAHVVALDPAKGTVVWKYPFKDALNESSSTPILAGDQILVSSVTAGTIALKPGADKSEPEVVWKDKDLTCYFATPLPVSKDHVFLVTGKTPPFA